MRVKAVISYDGSMFYGFQRQKSTPHTVVGTIEKALRSFQIVTEVVGSGRTDRGVHATGQVIHFDLPDFWQDLSKLTLLLNRRLSGVAFRSIVPVSSTFHARFSARRRRYRYLFKSSPLSVFEEKYLAFYPNFDPLLLQKALSRFIGEHDFCYFYKTGSPIHTTCRTLYESRYYTYGKFHIVTFEANGFLRSQVRMMMACAMRYAAGKLSDDALIKQIEGEARSITELAPAAGLYLARIYY